MKKYQRRVEKELHNLVKYLNTLQPSEKKASIGFLVMNLVQSVDSKDEAIGFFQRLYYMMVKEAVEPSEQGNTRDFYVA